MEWRALSVEQYRFVVQLTHANTVAIALELEAAMRESGCLLLTVDLVVARMGQTAWLMQQVALRVARLQLREELREVLRRFLAELQLCVLSVGGACAVAGQHWLLARLIGVQALAEGVGVPEVVEVVDVQMVEQAMERALEQARRAGYAGNDARGEEAPFNDASPGVVCTEEEFVHVDTAPAVQPSAAPKVRLKKQQKQALKHLRRMGVVPPMVPQSLTRLLRFTPSMYRLVWLLCEHVLTAIRHQLHAGMRVCYDMRVASTEPRNDSFMWAVCLDLFEELLRAVEGAAQVVLDRMDPDEERWRQAEYHEELVAAYCGAARALGRVEGLFPACVSLQAVVACFRANLRHPDDAKLAALVEKVRLPPETVYEKAAREVLAVAAVDVVAKLAIQRERGASS